MKDSEEDWNEITLNDTLEMISGYEFKYGVESENKIDEDGDGDDCEDGDSDENEGESEVNGDFKQMLMNLQMETLMKVKARVK